MNLKLMPPGVDHMKRSRVAMPTPSDRLILLNGSMAPGAIMAVLLVAYGMRDLLLVLVVG